jgi:hypothetical protein
VCQPQINQETWNENFSAIVTSMTEEQSCTITIEVMHVAVFGSAFSIDLLQQIRCLLHE